MAGKVSSWLYEKKPLKKPKLGPSDVYPQEPKQKEDELTANNVSKGFSTYPSIQDEYGSARNTNIHPNTFGTFFSGILSKKQEINTFHDSAKKKPSINTKDAWLVTQRSKVAVDAWFRDLSTGAKTLTQLSRKVPIFNKKEEIFLQLYEFQVPMLKAAWFIKMSSAYSLALSESTNKGKKRQLPDQSQEWTLILCKFLKDLYQKICEYYHGSFSTSSSSIYGHSVQSSTGSVNIELVNKQWQYCTLLARHLFEEGLLDRQEFFNWILDLLEKIKSVDDSVLRIVVALLLQYIEDFTESELISRRLAYHCAKKLNHLIYDYFPLNSLNISNTSGRSSSEQVVVSATSTLPTNITSTTATTTITTTATATTTTTTITTTTITTTTTTATTATTTTTTTTALAAATPTSTTATTIIANTALTPITNSVNNLTSISSNNLAQIDPLVVSFRDLLNCFHHRNIILGLSSILQMITLKCPTAMVWQNIGESRLSPVLNGSPLDHLPCPPSLLPMPPRPHNLQLRQELYETENEIRYRSRAVESKWCSDKFAQTAPGAIINRLLNVLEVLDRHCFDRVDASNSLDSLYSKIFNNTQTFNSFHENNSGNKSYLSEKLLKDVIASEEPVIELLCEWAVTTKRTGEHRALVVAKLLEKRQNELLIDRETNEKMDEKEVCNGGELSFPIPNGCLNSNLKSNEEPSLQSESILFTPIYQNWLTSFLDSQGPVLDEKNGNSETKQAFSNLVFLFGELIRCDVFSHDAYMCALISRGQFANSPCYSSIITSNVDNKSSNKSDGSLTSFVPNLPSTNSLPPLSSTSSSHLVSPLDVNNSSRSLESSLPMFEPVTDPSGSNRNDPINWDVQQQMDMDDARLDADLDKLLQHIKEGQQNNMNDQTDILLPDSVSSDKEDDHGHGMLSGFDDHETNSKESVQRHLLYTTHFPLPQDESTNHDCNQRHVLLYGVGKARDEARHLVKKTTKDILKLFNRKSSMDISDGAKIKKKENFNFELALTKFQSLSYFDQHVVTSSCAVACIEMFDDVGNGNSVHLPLIESIAFLFDLMEMALNIHGLIDFVIQLLKEMPDVEAKLIEKCPILAGSYCTTIGLYITGVLYRYQSCLLTSQEETIAVWEGLFRLMKTVSNPSDCSSAERCILCYLYDLYNSANYIRIKFHDIFNNLYSKIALVMYSQLKPIAINLSWNTTCLSDYINNPKLKIDMSQLKQLNDHAPYRYSFVCNAVHAITIAKDVNRLNELSILCAELTSRCPVLSSEWLGLLKALCCSSNHNCGFVEILAAVKVSDLSVHDNLAVFTSILIARRCFSLQDFVIHCALPSLLAVCPLGGGGQDAQAGARLTCHFLLCLFRTSEPPLSSCTVSSTPATTLYSLTSPSPSNLQLPSTPGQSRSSSPLYVIKHPCDRYLLAAAHSSMRAEAVLTLLKAILVLGDSVENVRESKLKDMNTKEISISEILGPLDDSDFGDFGLLSFSGNKTNNRFDHNSGNEIASLSDFAKHALKQISSQEWVLERCLRDPEMLSKQDLFHDPLLTHKQAQQLLQMICHPKASSADTEIDQKQQISKILQNLDEWTILVSWLQLQLMYTQCSSSQVSTDIINWLDNVAKATIDFFQQSSEENSKMPNCNSNQNIHSSHNSKGGLGTKSFPPSKSHGPIENSQSSNETKDNRVWLVAPLIEKLPPAVQGKILKVAANVLESGNWISSGSISSQNSYSYSKSKDRGFQQQKNNSSNNSSSSTLLNYPPFLSLVLMCLKGQDEQRECLLTSLYNQLQQAIKNEDKNDDLKSKLPIQDGLQLRLSLVGGMFDMIQKSPSLTIDWSVLFLQLISNGIVEPQLNYELFTTVLDMLALLIHTTQSSESSESREESRKHYQNLMKKLRKEFAYDKVGLGITIVKQLLPFCKQQCEVITCEPMGSLIDTKGNKIAGFDSIDKKQGLQVAEKQKVSPWDLLEGHKNPAPLSWTWFGAMRIERKPLRGEENHNILAWHTHNFKQPTSYYLEPPPLPPEDVIEPSPVSTPTTINETKPSPLPTPIIPHQHPSHSSQSSGIISMLITEESLKRERVTPIETKPKVPAAKKPKTQRRRRAPKNAAANAMPGPPSQGPSPLRMQNYDSYVGPPPPPPTQQQQQQQQQWYNQQQTGPLPPPPHQANQQFYNPQGPGSIAPSNLRYDRPTTNSKALLNTMIKNRQPGAANSQFITQTNGPSNNGPNPCPIPGQAGPTSITSQPQTAPPPPHMFQRQTMIMQRQMRPRQPTPPPQMNVPQTTQMFQMQSNNQVGLNNQTLPPNPMHYMPPHTQSNYGQVSSAPPSNIVYGNNIQMQTIDQSLGPPNQINQGYQHHQNSALLNQPNQMQMRQMHSQVSHHPQAQQPPPAPPQSQPQQQPQQQPQSQQPQSYHQQQFIDNYYNYYN